MPDSTVPASRGRILVVDDEADIRESLEMLLQSEGYTVDLAHNGTEGLARFDAANYDMVLLDLMMPDKSGMEVLAEIRERDRETPVAMITAYGSVEVAVQALKAGASDYFSKPWDNEKLLLEMGRLIGERKLTTENTQLKRALKQRYAFPNIVGKSDRMLRVLDLVAQVAPSRATILVTGETGTGKELIAKAIHANSTRSDQMFIAVNSGSLPPDLLESTLFGHVKGAFTSAVSSRKGYFEAANRGTIFFDEIGTIGIETQAKLLRVIQEKEFTPLGSNEVLRADVRIIAATHRNLEEQIAQNRFREDLFYRLNVFPIEVPALRHRVEDIPLLVGDLLARFKAENRGEISLSSRALAALQRHQWPGNVRELANLMERLVILYPHQTIDLKDLPEKFQCYIDQDKFVTDIDLDDEKLALSALNAESDQPDQFSPRLPEEGLDLREHLNQLECELIRQALEDCNGVVAHAATRLRMRRTTLTEKLRKYGLRADEGQD